MPNSNSGLLASNEPEKKPFIDPDRANAISLGFKSATGSGLNANEKTQLEALKRRNKI